MPNSSIQVLLRTMLVVLTLGLSTGAFAWGAKGHRIIGALAEEHLTAAARAAIDDILEGEDLATVSTWADDMRSARDKPRFWSEHAANWHYVNIAPGKNYASSDKSPRGDAYIALATFIAILRDEPIPAGPVREGLEFYFGDLAAHKAEVRRFALKFVVHILGDLQQPLHSGYADDRGGNDVRLTWFGQQSNLHSIWDTQLIEQQGLSYTEFAQRLSGRISRMSAADIRVLEGAPPIAWIEESQDMLGSLYARHAANTELSYAYVAEFLPVVETQLIKGGLRTAYVLNTVFGSGPAGE